MGFVQDFRDFAIKGNVFDLAIGVIMGGAFGKIVTALIDHIISPILGLAGGINFNEMYIMLSKKPTFVEGMNYADAKASGVALGLGAFVTETINFLIMAFVVFLMVKAYTTAKKRFEKAAVPVVIVAAGPSEKDYLKEIRDLLARR